MFSGRKKELKYLQNRYESNKSEFVVLYGRRRIGKTELLKQFALDKNHIFYSAIETVDKSQLEMFSKELLKSLIFLSSFSIFIKTVIFILKLSLT